MPRHVHGIPTAAITQFSLELNRLGSLERRFFLYLLHCLAISAHLQLFNFRASGPDPLRYNNSVPLFEAFHVSLLSLSPQDAFISLQIWFPTLFNLALRPERKRSVLRKISPGAIRIASSLNKYLYNIVFKVTCLRFFNLSHLRCNSQDTIVENNSRSLSAGS